MSMRAERVATRAQLRDFIDLAPRLASLRQETDRWVPLFATDIAQWHKGTGWFAEAVELWLLRDTSGGPVARMICHRSPALAAKLAHSDDDSAPPPPTLFFGALEAADADVLRELIDLIRTRAVDLRCDRVFGPVSPLPNVTGGLLTGGAQHPGFFDTVWNPEFFADEFLRSGFAPWGRAHTWEVRVGDIPAARATAPSPGEWEARGLRRRPVTRLGVGAFAHRLLPTLNAAFAALPYYTQISPAQLKAQMSGLPALMDPDLVVDVVGRDDPDDAPPRCFALVIPDPLAVLRRHEGRMGPATVTDLLLHRRALRDAVLIIQGTAPQHQGQGFLSLVIRELNSALVAGGYRRLRVTFIAEDNPASAKVFAASGGRPLHELAFFETKVGADPANIKELFAHAARSPSAHNAQPWVPRLVRAPAQVGAEAKVGAEANEDPQPAEVVVTVDPTRCLPAGDPEHLDLHLAMGCWVESFSIAAAEVGLDVGLDSVEGRGPDLEIRLRLQASADGALLNGGAWPRFTTADLHHRQVDRGPLARDDEAFSTAFAQINEALSDLRLRLVIVPDALWRTLLGRASIATTSRPRIFAEALDWCRFDKRDPRYFEDGLTAECLRLSPVLALPGSRLNIPALRRLIAAGAAGAVLPVSVVAKILAARRLSAAEVGSRFDRGGDAEMTADRRGDRRLPGPHHVILVAEETAGTRCSTRRELDMGRNLLRTWLLFDRFGLRVDVHSELKDCPETNQSLRQFLARADSTSSSASAGPKQRSPRPVAAFTVGRSRTPVPRSHRKPT